MDSSVNQRRLRPFVALEVSALTSGMGNGVVMVAFPWLALELTGSPTAAGVMSAITALPLLLSLVFSGVAVDMLGRRRVAIVADVVSLVSVALVPVLGSLIGLSFPLLVVLSMLGAVVDPGGITAREAMLPEAARAARMSLDKANGIHEAVWSAAALVGAGVGGFALAAIGGERTLLIPAVLFIIGICAMALVAVPGSGRPSRAPDLGSVWPQTLAGLRFLWREPVLRAMAILGAVAMGCWLPIEGIVLPTYFQEIGRPDLLGLTVVALGVGAVAGTLAFVAFGARFRRRPLYLGCLIVSGAGVVGMALIPPFPVFLALCVVAGFAYGPLGPMVNTEMQSRAPDDMRGRVVGLMVATDQIGGPITYFLIGPLITGLGVTTAFLIMAIGVFVLALASVAVRPLRQMGQSPA